MQILALGGGGFSDEGPSAILDRYLRSLLPPGRPRILFLPTASGDSVEYLVKFYTAFPSSEWQPSHLPLFKRTHADLAKTLQEQDAVYVGGGNTANMLALWRLHGVDRLLRETGAVLAGVSAGALCWFQGGITDSFGPQMAPLHDGLGLLEGTFCPHYDGEPLRRPLYNRLVRDGFPAGVAAEDGVALHYVDGRLHRVVTAREGGRAWRVRPDGETLLDADFIGGSR